MHVYVRLLFHTFDPSRCLSLFLSFFFRSSSHSLAFNNLLIQRGVPGLSAKALFANVAVLSFSRHPALLPLRGNLRLAHAAGFPRLRGIPRRTALFQVALVAQILLPLRLVFTRSPLRARARGAAAPALHRPAGLQTLSSFALVASSAQILPFVQFTLVPTTTGVRSIANETHPVRVRHVVLRPTREAQILVVAVRRPGLTEISSALLPLRAVRTDARALNPVWWIF